jgi:MarR family transcriptional regulator, transcriptional regulator for hemolysin
MIHTMATELAAPTEHTTASPSCLTTNLGWLLSTANHVFATEIAVALAPLELGSRGYCVLATAIGRELTQTELAKLIGLDKTTMVVTVDELERAGLARRVPSSVDRRARVIEVTDAGERKVAEGQRIIDEVQADVLNSLASEDRDAFVRALTTLVADRLSEAPACHPPVRRRETRVS